MSPREASLKLVAQLTPAFGEAEAQAMTRLVMDHVCGEKKHLLPALDEKQLAQLDMISARLLRHEPLQYILQEAWFCSMRFYVDNQVLIPRPETEELVEWVISHCRFPIDTLKILDIGSGSGCIAISLKRRIRKAEVWSIDKSPGALAVARRNAGTLGTRVEFLEMDFLNRQNWPTLSKYDIIVSNPPYVPERDKSSMQPQVLEHEPHLALFVPDNDALCFYRAIAEFGRDHLSPGGWLFFEIHEDLGRAVVDLLERAGYTAELKKDMQQKDRLVKAGLR